jgi:tRNA threonylcarbamoyladenosine biosynthesis protein TsaB
MRILAIDTVTEMCSAALSVDSKSIDRQDKAINRHSNVVLGMVQALLDEAGISLSQLDLIVADVGPGSFTGIRIGMGVAQGLAYGADLPLLGVDALSTLAQGVTEDGSGNILAAIDARMNQVYWAEFTQQSGSLALWGSLHLSHPEKIEGVEQAVYGTGSGWDAYANILQTRMDTSGYAPDRFPLARHALECATRKPRSDWVAAGDLLPVYLRNDVAKVSTKLPLYQHKTSK